MKPARIAVWAVAAVAAPCLAACGGSSPGGSGSPGPAASGQSRTAVPGQSRTAASAAPEAPARAGGPGSRLTPPGAHLGFGREARVGWVPPSEASAQSAHPGIRLQVTVESIEKGTMADFRNVDLNAAERKSTPCYVTLRVTALGSTPPPADSDPAITFTAIDDRGQEQQSITFLGTFSRCDDTTPPKPFVNGKSYQSCLAYLIPGGGSIQKVEWNDGPAAADQVTPYFDNPIVWAGN